MILLFFIPRRSQIPKPKPLTKWEKFALDNKIKNKDRSKLVYDEASGEFRRRFGYKRANDSTDQWLIEDRPGLDAEDPFLKLKMDKKKRITENEAKHQKNLASIPGQKKKNTLSSPS